MTGLRESRCGACYWKRWTRCDKRRPALGRKGWGGTAVSKLLGRSSFQENQRWGVFGNDVYEVVAGNKKENLGGTRIREVCGDAKPKTG